METPAERYVREQQERLEAEQRAAEEADTDVQPRPSKKKASKKKASKKKVSKKKVSKKGAKKLELQNDAPPAELRRRRRGYGAQRNQAPKRRRAEAPVGTPIPRPRRGK